MPELVVPRLGLFQRSFRIVMKYDLLLIRRLEATSQHDCIRGVLPEIHVMPAINRRHEKAQLLYLRGHGRKRRVPIAEAIEPPNCAFTFSTASVQHTRPSLLVSFTPQSGEAAVDSRGLEPACRYVRIDAFCCWSISGTRGI
jgi:hypothetical protein